MKTIPTAITLAVMGCAALGGCVQTTPEWDRHFGEAERMMMAQQVLNPDAGMKELPPAMDGSASRESVVRYRSTFKEPPAPQNVFNIGVGSGGSGSGSGGAR